jgi:hypothetical protein
MHSIYYIHIFHHYTISDLLIPHFLKSEVFWIAFGSMITAGALFYTILKNRYDKNQSIKNIKEALYFEILTNVNLLFSKEVERGHLSDVIVMVRNDYIKNVSDQAILFDIQKLYLELDYYKSIINQYWLKLELNDRNPGEIVQEKQLQTMNSFIKFFGYQEVFKKDNESGDDVRNRAINEKNECFEEWKAILKRKIDEIFK